MTSVRHTVAYPFDRYRQLESDLAAIGVGKDKASCSISVPFPETFTQSSFGISLSTPQLISRCTKLHSWMAAVLVSFHSFPRAAQTLVVGFLQLDNPPAPIKDVIIDMYEFIFSVVVVRCIAHYLFQIRRGSKQSGFQDPGRHKRHLCTSPSPTASSSCNRKQVQAQYEC